MADMLRIAMNGVTGRMGCASTCCARSSRSATQGGVTLDDGSRVQTEPVLVGRNAAKLQALAEAHGVAEWSTDLDAALPDPVDIYFDAQVTSRRVEAVTDGASRRASTSTARSRSPNLDEAIEPRAPRARRRASSTAWCRTSCSCPACAS